MTATHTPPVGLVLGSMIPPEEVLHTARLGEDLGYSELWLAEDYFFTGGISGATAALSATDRIPVGLGIVSAVVRHPALLAMEIATLSRMYPGRMLPGVGLGVPGWLRQMGLHPESQLKAMRECLTCVRRLLDGEEVTFEGQTFQFDRVKLTHPPSERVPLYMGAIGPKMLDLASEIADGIVVSVLASTEYVAWAREVLAKGAATNGRDLRHKVACFGLFSVDTDARRAKESLRDVVAFYLGTMGPNALTDVHGSSEALRAMIQRGGAEAVRQEMPDAWLDELVIAGDPEECAEKIGRYLAAGADSVVLFPTPIERAEEIVRLASTEVLPRVPVNMA